VAYRTLFLSFVASASPPIGHRFSAYGILLCFVFFLGSVVEIYYITRIIVLVRCSAPGVITASSSLPDIGKSVRMGRHEESALRESVKWAGESIHQYPDVRSFIGFGVMSFQFIFIDSTMGMVLAAGIVIALLAALTLIPSIIRLIGDRIFYPSTMKTFSEDSKAMKGPVWHVLQVWTKVFLPTLQSKRLKYAWAIIIASGPHHYPSCLCDYNLVVFIQHDQHDVQWERRSKESMSWWRTQTAG